MQSSRIESRKVRSRYVELLLRNLSLSLLKGIFCVFPLQVSKKVLFKRVDEACFQRLVVNDWENPGYTLRVILQFFLSSAEPLCFPRYRISVTILTLIKLFLDGE